MRRRDLITAIAGWAAAWPVIARAQQSLPLIGFMSSRSSQDSEPHKEAFLHGLSEAGYVPGQNVRIEYRRADGHYERLAEIGSGVSQAFSSCAGCGWRRAVRCCRQVGDCGHSYCFCDRRLSRQRIARLGQSA